MGIASSSQSKAPPITSEAVTGAARTRMSFTSWPRRTQELPSEPWVASFRTNSAYSS